MRGYHGRPDATREALTDDGWLRTGDLARRGRLGFIEFAGRKKDVIKHGGYSVFAAEVEDVLGEHPDVLESAVVGVPDDRKGEVPAAVVRVRRDAQLAEPRAHRLGRRAAVGVQGAAAGGVRRRAAPHGDREGPQAGSRPSVRRRLRHVTAPSPRVQAHLRCPVCGAGFDTDTGDELRCRSGTRSTRPAATSTCRRTRPTRRRAARSRPSATSGRPSTRSSPRTRRSGRTTSVTSRSTSCAAASRSMPGAARRASPGSPRRTRASWSRSTVRTRSRPR